MRIKKILLLQLFVTLLALLAGCKETEMSDLVMRKGLAYQRGGGLYSGDVKVYFPQTQKEKDADAERRISLEGAFSDGRKEGDWLTYSWNGERKKIPYENGKRHGTAKWFYADDAVKREQRYANDMKHGGGVYYDANGNITKQVYYDRNRRRDPSPNRLAGIDKLTTDDEAPVGPGFFKVVLDLINDF